MSSELNAPILLLGASGMLGRAWTRCLEGLAIPYFAPTHRECDFLRPGEMREFLTQHQFSTAINCVGFTKVDEAETAREKALAINADAVGILAEHCQSTDSVLVHYSTDYVFDGHSVFGYTEIAEPNPCNFYGRSKLVGEELIRRSKCKHLIVRTSWLYSHEGHNFVRSIAKKILTGSALKVVDDQVGRPTHVDNLATMSFRLGQDGHRGTYNITDSGICSWFEFATEIRRQIGQSTPIRACSTSDYALPAERPAFSVLDIAKLTKSCGKPPHWTLGLKKVIEQLRKPAPIPKALAVKSRQTSQLTSGTDIIH